jgi:hypothetical protein
MLNRFGSFNLFVTHLQMGQLTVNPFITCLINWVGFGLA